MRTQPLSPFLALSVCALTAAGCGGGGGATHQTTTAATAAERPAVVRTKRVKAKPRPVTLRLQLPGIGLSSAHTVTYAAPTRRALLRGAISPPGTTLLLEDADGNKSVINSVNHGRFEVRALLDPGDNVFRFTATRLGSKSASAELRVSFTGPAARHLQHLIQTNPAKYLPPASAGINRRLPKDPGVTAPVKGVPANITIDPINAPPPPAEGGAGQWVDGFTLTEYYPSPEQWFRGAVVPAPGLPGRHRIDWLYSATGVTMEGDGIGLDGRQYHVANVGRGGWVDRRGKPTSLSSGNAFWRVGPFYRNANGIFTMPLGNGGWTNGEGTSYVPNPGITFAPGPSLDLRYYRSIAVDPRVIPLGSRVYIPAYASINGGWFEAVDTGGAIIGRHIDVFRPPPSSPGADDGLGYVRGARVYVVKAGG